jgi:hypothetical protein
MTLELHHDPAWLRKTLNDATKLFNDSVDKRLLFDDESDEGERRSSVGERAIAHRLAVHLERQLERGGYPNEAVRIVTDCEYNRHRGAVKQLDVREDLKRRVIKAKRALRRNPKRIGWYAFSIFPDIIVHERGVDKNNLLVIEIKRASNSIDDDYDALKLELFTLQGEDSGYGYKLGASVIARDKGPSDERELYVSAWFINGVKV